MKKYWLVPVALFAMYCWYRYELLPVDSSSTERHVVTIAAGDSGGAIANMLAEQHLIRSPFFFRVYTRVSGRQSELQAGRFVLQKSFSAQEIVEAFTNGKTEEISVTIPEGFTVKDIDAKLADMGLIEPGDIVNCANTCDFATFEFLPSSTNLAQRGGKLEGYLYPDTYFVDAVNFVPKFFLERMLGAFRTKIVQGLGPDLASSEYSLHQVVTMASLVEEETMTNEERPIVAGILWKRFELPMSLGVDAAVRYILDKPTAAITAADLQVDSPYNLRKVAGLPPGPIANPSLASISAVLHPQESAYWYYLHDSSGGIHYAKTNDEHNANKAKYIR